MGIGWGVAYQIFTSKFPKNESVKFARLIFWGVFISSWIGAKLFFMFTSPSGTLSGVNFLDFWTGGGFVFYGGFLLSLIFLGVIKIIYRKFDFNHLAPMVPALVFGHGIGRVGCFLAGCCYGKITTFFLGVKVQDQFRHPTQLYEALFLFSLGYFYVKTKLHPKQQVIIYFLSYGLFRFVLEFFRDDRIRGFWILMTPSQWISLLLIIFVLGLSVYRGKSVT